MNEELYRMYEAMNSMESPYKKVNQNGREIADALNFVVGAPIEMLGEAGKYLYDKAYAYAYPPEQPPEWYDWYR